ncbi:MAG: DUF2490 domain-containing protein [Legionellales bacterium]|jgi:hypothetical protein
MHIKKIFYLLIGFFSSPVLASSQSSELWLDASINDYFQQHEKLNYSLELQTRFVDEKDYYEFSYASAALGYRETPNLSFWAGYQRDTQNEISGAAPENIIWEQMVWQIFENETMVIRTRTRFEQKNRLHQNEWGNLFRERITAFFPDQLFNIYTPIIYNEFFIKLNQTSWSDTDTFEENRLFIGLAIPTSNTSFLETGYIQQTVFNDSGNEYNNILYLSINFNPSGQAIAKYIR